jgi:hypothetical protein
MLTEPSWYLWMRDIPFVIIRRIFPLLAYDHGLNIDGSIRARDA